MLNTQRFADLNLSAEMLKTIQRKGFEEPTPIQREIIPLLMEKNQDLVGQAQTGTGKTAAFGIPILEKLTPAKKTVQAIILTPTRELAIQVSEELNSLKGKKRLNIVPIYGGQSIQLQLSHLKKGIDIVVGTPGRVLDHLYRGTLDLSQVQFVVLDEADEMLNMGFIEDVERILQNTPDERTTLLFSATMPREILSIARRYMGRYKTVSVESEQMTTDLTDQMYFEVTEGDKFNALCRIIDIQPTFYGLVFCRTKVDVDNVASHLVNRGYAAEALHGDISQVQREKILRKFKNKRINILVATDVAARGIDIQNLTHVINYSLPQNPESYVHRIGRTGRAGQTGTAITFVTYDEFRKLKHIKRVIKTDIRRESIPTVEQILEAKRTRITTTIQEIASNGLKSDYLDMARDLLSETEPEKAIAAVLQYALQDSLNPEQYSPIKTIKIRDGSLTRLFIARGKRDNFSKRTLVEFLEERSGVPGKHMNDVEVFDTFSFVSVNATDAHQILAAFRKKRNGKSPMVEVARPGGNNGRRRRRK